MPIALDRRHIAALLAAFVLTAAGISSTATYTAPAPTADLEPVGAAETLVAILQGSQSIVWTSLTGPVTSYRVEGWPVETAGNELGGALVIERPADGTGGVIDFGEKPRSLTFQMGD